MTTIESQIEQQMRSAFWNLLKEKVGNDPPDFDWITRLYAEIRDRLCSFLKPESRTRNEIYASFDPELFSQMIRNNAFEGSDMLRLIEMTFGHIGKLQAPYRDEDMRKRKQEMLDYAEKGGSFSVVVPMFIRSTHELLDMLHEDMQALRKKED